MRTSARPGRVRSSGEIVSRWWPLCAVFSRQSCCTGLLYASGGWPRESDRLYAISGQAVVSLVPLPRSCRCECPSNSGRSRGRGCRQRVSAILSFRPSMRTAPDWSMPVVQAGRFAMLVLAGVGLRFGCSALRARLRFPGVVIFYLPDCSTLVLPSLTPSVCPTDDCICTH